MGSSDPQQKSRLQPGSISARRDVMPTVGKEYSLVPQGRRAVAAEQRCLQSIGATAIRSEKAALAARAAEARQRKLVLNLYLSYCSGCRSGGMAMLIVTFF